LHSAHPIVKVAANFLSGNDLDRYLRKYSHRSDEAYACWGQYAFTAQSTAEADALLILNSPSSVVEMNVDPARVIAFMMEPGIRNLHPWMYRTLHQYGRVYSPVTGGMNVYPSHGFLGWHFDHDWHFLRALPMPVKTKTVSCIASGLKQLKGHRLRTGFVNMLPHRIPQVDLFGKHSQYLADKLDGLLNYKYSIAIENSARRDYFTEKINDCFLAYTVPIYYGCTNIADYYPEKALVHIDISRPQKAMETIERLLQEDDWEARVPALLEARERALNQYQPLAGAARILDGIPTGPRSRVSVKPVNIPAWKQKLASWLR
jgi:hypothetical protein